MADDVTTRGSITWAISRLRRGDDGAVRELWDRYFEQIIRLARHRFGDRPRRAVDEEDVALDVLERIVEGTRQGDFPDLVNRDDFQGLTVVLTAQKVLDVIRGERAKKRGGGEVSRASELECDPTSGSAVPGLSTAAPLMPRWDPTPELAASIADECERLLSTLNDETLRRVAEWRWEGYTNQDIAAMLGVVPRTVERKLSIIRNKWLARAVV